MHIPEADEDPAKQHKVYIHQGYIAMDIPEAGKDSAREVDLCT